jgi:hypothetical protein
MARANGMRSTILRRAPETALNSTICDDRIHASRRHAWSIVLASITAVLLLLCAFPATASETITYSYDALGRLVKVVHSGTVNNSTSSCYSYDHADNRTNVMVSTTTGCVPPPPGISFSVNDVSVTEGGNLVFTVTKTGTASGTTTVDYATSDGTATAGSDYAAVGPLTLTFLSSDITKTVSIQTTDDTLVESAETVLFNLSNPTGGATIGDGQAIGTINDNESACAGVSFTIASNAAVTEGTNSVFTVTKAGSTSDSCSVSYATATGTGNFPAIQGTDFTATTGTLTFTSGQTSKTVSVPTINDTAAESSETFSMTLSSPDKAGTLGTPYTATATINDDDQCRSVSFTIASNGAVTEGTSSTFTITKTGAGQIGSCTVDYATANLTATAPGDYTATSGTLSFTLNDAAKTVTVPTITDGLTEGAETFKLNLSNPSNNGALGTPNSATATINDGGGVCSGVSFSVNDVTDVEGGSLLFTVTKSGTTSSTCSVSYATADGTATAPDYYTAVSGTLAFGSSQTTQTVTVNTNDLCRLNVTKLMYLNLSNATLGGGISDTQGVGSIQASGGGACGGGQSPVQGTTTDPPTDTTTVTDPTGTSATDSTSPPPDSTTTTTTTPGPGQ